MILRQNKKLVHNKVKYGPPIWTGSTIHKINLFWGLDRRVRSHLWSICISIVFFDFLHATYKLYFLVGFAFEMSKMVGSQMKGGYYVVGLLGFMFQLFLLTESTVRRQLVSFFISNFHSCMHACVYNTFFSFIITSSSCACVLVHMWLIMLVLIMFLLGGWGGWCYYFPFLVLYCSYVF